MNKLKTALFAVGVLFVAMSHAHAYDKVQHQKDIVTYNFKGSTNPAVAVSSTGRLNMTDGIVNVVESIAKPRINSNAFGSGATASTTAITMPSISSSAYINQRISTSVLTSQGTTYATSNNGDFRQRVLEPYALTLSLWNILGNSTHTYITTATIVGMTSLGQDVIEKVVVTSNTNVVSKYGYIKITSITFGAPAAMTTSPVLSEMFLVVGTTATYGLSNDIEQSSDVFKVSAYGVDFSSYSVNQNFDTIKLTVSPNSPPPPDGLDVRYRAITSPPNRRR